MKIEKGQPGYIKARKMRYLLYAVVEFAMVAAVFILGYVQTKSRLNLFTVLAIIGCLPAAKMLVEFITMAPYKSIDTAIYKEIEDIINERYEMKDRIWVESDGGYYLALYQRK